MSHTRLFRFNLILLVAGLIIASWHPVVALTSDPAFSARSASALAPDADPIYVDADAPGPVHDGLSWTTAYTDLQTALATAVSGGEIWVAEGIYTPGDAGDRAATFRPQGDVALYGGFGGNETALTERDWVAHPTVLSGDIDHNDVTTASGVVTDTANIIGTNAYHVMTLDSNATVDGFIITAGQATGDLPDSNGGGMYTFYANPTLTNVTFSGNRASEQGGGIYNLYSNLALLSVIFNNNNQARFGGGMYNHFSNATLTDVTFSDNHTSERGGGMVDSGGGSTLTNVTFSNNQTDGAGGGIYFDNYNSSTLISVTFTGNQAGYGGGGGIYNSYSSLTLITGTLSSNRAFSGAGMFNAGGSPTLTDVTFSDNLADQGGGGLYNAVPNLNLTLTRVTFSNNQARDGGGMYNIDPNVSTLTDVTFTGNQALNYGGGMYNGSSSAPTLITVTFSGNQAMDGGGMYNDNQASPTLTNVTFNDNLSYFGNGGGGMFNSSSTPTLFNVTFTGNSATGNNFDGGGGMYNMSSDPILTNVAFNDNQTDAYGGGIYNSGSDPTLTNVTFNNNQAGSGGGMYNYSYSSPTLVTVTFASNLADVGGGMLNTVGSNPTLADVTFSDNRATSSGGGMENDWDSNPTLTNVTLNGNSANDGGGMRNFNSNPNLNNVVFSGNQATGYGGGMANDGSHPTLINTTFSGNQAGYGGGGGIYNTDSNPTLVNCILWGDDASTDPELHNIGTSVPNITYSDVYWAEGIYTGTGNLNLDPQFVSPITATVAPTTMGDYRLLSTSPVIDAGNNFSVTVSMDRDGNPRLMNVPEIADTGLGTPPIVDMGAYEVQVEVATLTVSVAGAGVGVIGSTPAGIDCSLTCTAQFTRGSVVTLTATPNTGSIFTGWSGDLSDMTNPTTLTMDADKSVTGTFALNTYTLTLNTIGNGTVTSNPPGQTFAYGTVVTLTAIPNTHWAFTGWLGALSGRTNPITLTMDANKIVIAIFRPGHQR